MDKKKVVPIYATKHKYKYGYMLSWLTCKVQRTKKKSYKKKEWKIRNIYIFYRTGGKTFLYIWLSNLRPSSTSVVIYRRIDRNDWFHAMVLFHIAYIYVLYMNLKKSFYFWFYVTNSLLMTHQIEGIGVGYM